MGKMTFTKEQIEERRGLAQKLKEQRLRLRLPQTLVADKFGVSNSLWSTMEAGRGHSMTTERMKNILSYLTNMKEVEVESFITAVNIINEKTRGAVVPGSVRERLLKLMKERHLDSVDAGRLLKVSSGYIRNICTGRAVPKGTRRHALEVALAALDAPQPVQATLPNVEQPVLITQTPPVPLRAEPPPAKKPLEAFKVEKASTLSTFLRLDGTTKYSFLPMGDGIVVIIG